MKPLINATTTEQVAADVFSRQSVSTPRVFGEEHDFPSSSTANASETADAKAVQVESENEVQNKLDNIVSSLITSVDSCLACRCLNLISRVLV
jgi:hypothetical protein